MSDDMHDYWKERIESGNAVDLGCDHWAAFVEDGKGNRVGMTDIHRKADGNYCAGAVTFDVPQTADNAYGTHTKWTVNTMEPLDLSPSLLCRSCGSHGFIRQGKWVPA